MPRHLTDSPIAAFCLAKSLTFFLRDEDGVSGSLLFESGGIGSKSALGSSHGA